MSTATLAHRIDLLINQVSAFCKHCDTIEMTYKSSPDKWSKQEILGHLIDSGINNLQRFTEIQFSPKPYPILKYNQDQLVIANGYNAADIQELLACWTGINRRIQSVVKSQSDQTLSFAIDLGHEEISDLAFLMTDYVDHMEHHVRQIMA